VIGRNSPIGGYPEEVEVLAGVLHNEGIGVGGPRSGVDVIRVEVVEVDRADHGFGNTRGESHGDAEALAIDWIVGAGTASLPNVG